MTRKDFELIASVLRRLPGKVNKGMVVDAFRQELVRTNSRFDSDRFTKACFPEGYEREP